MFFGTIRKHSQALWIPIIVLVSISMVWFFTNSNPSDLLQSRGQDGTGPTVGQQQVLIEAAVRYWQQTGQLPRPKQEHELLGAADLDGDGNQDMTGFVLMGAIRQDLLERTLALDIQFDDDAINSIIREQLSNPTGQFQQKAYDKLIQRYGEADVRMYFHDELAIRHLHQVMGLGGGMVSRRAIRPLVEQSLLKYDTEVAVFRASEYTNKVTNVTERLMEYYTNNKATYKEDDRVKFAWLKIAIPTNKADQKGINKAVRYQTDVYRDLDQNATLAALSKIAANLNPPLEIERIELAEGNLTSHNLASVFSQVRNGVVGDVSFPNGQAIPGPNGVYFAGVEEEIEGSLPEFKNLTPGRSNEVRLEFLEEETQKLAREAGRAFYTNLTATLAEGNQTFEQFCRLNKVEMIPPPIPLFSSTTQPGPEYKNLTNRVELSELQQAVRAMDSSKEKTPVITGFNPNPHGGWILNLKQREPAKTEEIEAELNNEVLARRRRGLGQATQPHPVRSFSQQGYQMADPTWSFRQLERIKLKLYIAAKKNRGEEIDGELEKLSNQLTKLTQQGNPDATPAELVKQEQQMNELRQQRRQLEGEREIISQAKTRLEKLQK